MIFTVEEVEPVTENSGVQNIKNFAASRHVISEDEVRDQQIIMVMDELILLLKVRKT